MNIVICATSAKALERVFPWKAHKSSPAVETPSGRPRKIKALVTGD